MSGSGSSGVAMLTVPIFEASGQAGSAFVPRRICSELQAASPFAEEGEIRIPCGSVTCASRTGGVAIARSLPEEA